MKKLLAIMLTAVMLLALAIPAFAVELDDDENPDTGNIDIMVQGTLNPVNENREEGGTPSICVSVDWDAPSDTTASGDCYKKWDAKSKQWVDADTAGTFEFGNDVEINFTVINYSDTDLWAGVAVVFAEDFDKIDFNPSISCDDIEDFDDETYTMGTMGIPLAENSDLHNITGKFRTLFLDGKLGEGEKLVFDEIHITVSLNLENITVNNLSAVQKALGNGQTAIKLATVTLSISTSNS